MKNEVTMVWVRLKPEIKEKLIRDRDNYPASINALIKTLKHTYTFSHLRGRDLSDLITFGELETQTLTYMDYVYGDRFLIKK